MKISHFLIITLFGLCITFVACNSKKDSTTTEGQMTTDTTATQGQMVAPGTTGTTGTTASSGTEPHYKCNTAGCKGSGTAQGKCPVCGADLVHNQAFHAQAGAEGSSPVNPVQINPTSGTNPATGNTATPTPPPAKNAKGEYHYTCPNGHEGAAGAGNCAKCGTALVHNQAYHNQ